MVKDFSYSSLWVSFLDRGLGDEISLDWQEEFFSMEVKTGTSNSTSLLWSKYKE